MDSNGRQRTSIPGSSTFRRLPTLTRSPFRRADKNSSASSNNNTTSNNNNNNSAPNTPGIDPPLTPDSASRVSAFPSLARVVVDDTSLSSALFGTSISEEAPTNTAPSSLQPQSALGPASATQPPSIELASPQPNAIQPASTLYPAPPPSSSQPAFKSSAASTRSGISFHSHHTSTLPSINTLPASSPAGPFDLEPITYPARLAQIRPPASSPSPPPPNSNSTTTTNTTNNPSVAGSTPASPANHNVLQGSVSSPSASVTSPSSAPAVPARSANRYRDFTLGAGTAALASAMNLTTQNLMNAQSSGMQHSPSFNNVADRDRVLAPNGQTSATTPNLAGHGSVDSPNPSGSSSAARDAGSTGREARDARDGGSRVPSGSEQTSRSSRKKDSASVKEDGASTRVRRPPKARERDATGSPAADDDSPLQPTLPAAKVSRAPASSMYFSPVAAHGRPPGQALRAHTGTLVGDRIWFLGGVDARSCWRGVANFDTESYQWTTCETHGEALPPLRAHTTTLVGDRLYIFGGGDGPTYSNEVWEFDTKLHRFSKPSISTPRSEWPPPRRAHTTVLFRNFLVVFGGGNGQAALNDVWALDVSDPKHLSWKEWRSRGDLPQKKGYHTANLVGDKMVVFGGSDGHASFSDVHVLNLQTLTWSHVETGVKHSRLSHTATQVGSYLFVIGGHNGQTYAQDVLLFNLVTLSWEAKVPRGVAPPGRGYHVAVLHDGRIFLSGGYNGVVVFDDLWSLELGAAAYLPQVPLQHLYEDDSDANVLKPLANGHEYAIAHTFGQLEAKAIAGDPTASPVTGPAPGQAGTGVPLPSTVPRAYAPPHHLNVQAAGTAALAHRDRAMMVKNGAANRI